jgi:hypothetical protein
LKPRLQIFVLAPAAAVAVYCLMGDAGMWSFLKKVGATYLFFTVLSIVLGLLWDVATPIRHIETPRKPGEKGAKADAGQGGPGPTGQKSQQEEQPPEKTGNETVEPAAQEA